MGAQAFKQLGFGMCLHEQPVADNHLSDQAPTLSNRCPLTYGLATARSNPGTAARGLAPPGEPEQQGCQS